MKMKTEGSNYVLELKVDEMEFLTSGLKDLVDYNKEQLGKIVEDADKELMKSVIRQNETILRTLEGSNLPKVSDIQEFDCSDLSHIKCKVLIDHEIYDYDLDFSDLITEVEHDIDSENKVVINGIIGTRQQWQDMIISIEENYSDFDKMIIKLARM